VTAVQIAPQDAGEEAHQWLSADRATLIKPGAVGGDHHADIPAIGRIPALDWRQAILVLRAKHGFEARERRRPCDGPACLPCVNLPCFQSAALLIVWTHEATLLAQRSSHLAPYGLNSPAIGRFRDPCRGGLEIGVKRTILARLVTRLLICPASRSIF
jgi:hypothetical protein